MDVRKRPPWEEFECVCVNMCDRARVYDSENACECVLALGDCAEQKRFMEKNIRYTRTYICTNTTICLFCI